MKTYVRRGLAAAIAMSVMRAATTRLGLLREAPPEAIARQTPTPRWMERRPVTQAAHLAYGGAGGAVFAALPTEIRERRWAGPAYGVVTWLLFEGAIAPILGLRQARERRIVERAVLLADHVLYGLIVAHPKGVPPR